MNFLSRLTAEEKNMAEDNAKIHDISLGDAFKHAQFERIEDEYDVTVADAAYNEYVKGGKKSRPISELWSELNL